MTPETLEDQLLTFRHDPEGFADFAYAWRQPGTPLATMQGLRGWQRRYLRRVGQQLKANHLKRNRVIREATCAGNGNGKSAVIGMLCCWAMSTSPDCRVIVTAGTETQLKTKTWPEVTKWFEWSITSDMFKIEETSIFHQDPNHARHWSLDRVAWNAKRPEAFAGAHNAGKRLVIVFDEASQIEDTIWEAVEGAMTDENTEIIWVVFGNPTRREGRFFECFNARRAAWSEGQPEQLDCRSVEGTNKELYDLWAVEYGDDSDFFRVHVKGMFPRASELQFIPADFIDEACKREAVYEDWDPLIMALDVSRGGSDDSVFFFRRGNDARTIAPISIPGTEVRNSVKLIAKAAQLADQYQPDYIFVDATGGSVGGPVADNLRRLGYTVQDVQFGAQAPVGGYCNMRAYIWGKLRDALETRLAIPDKIRLRSDLESPMFSHDNRDRIKLESKEDMKGRGLSSPDWADALAMTYAFPVKPKGHRLDKFRSRNQSQAKVAPGFLTRLKEREDSRYPRRPKR
jgi:hypothetical protein